jgi:hypothetical protein
MIVLRLLALVGGSLVLIVPPLVAAGTRRPDVPGWIAIGGLTGMALMAFSFLYVAAFGDRMRRSSQTRTLGGLLLMIPAVASITMLATRNDIPVLWASGALLSFTVLLFISFVYPAAPDRRQRPMRQRERAEPVLAVVHQHPAAKRRESGS